jgi:phospholipase/carboxylesterase
VLIGRDAVLWSEDPAVASRDKQLLVLLHGATSDEHDVFDRLTPLLPDGLVVVSPRGPVPEGDGYSWASPQDRTDATSDAEVAALGNSIAQSFLAWLDGVPAFRSVGVLGASQGACIALQALRAAPGRFDYAVNVSGYCLPGTEAGDRELRSRRPDVFWGRGRFDEVIPTDYVNRTADWLPRHSTLTERIYDIGHDISETELDDIADFVSAKVPLRRQSSP